jgi:Ca2+/H+ antiporter
MKLELLFKILAVALIGAAAFFLWQKNWEYMFAAAVLVACAYFLSMRFQIKERLDRRQQEESPEEIEEDPSE